MANKLKHSDLPYLKPSYSRLNVFSSILKSKIDMHSGLAYYKAIQDTACPVVFLRAKGLMQSVLVYLKPSYSRFSYSSLLLRAKKTYASRSSLNKASYSRISVFCSALKGTKDMRKCPAYQNSSYSRLSVFCSVLKDEKNNKLNLAYLKPIYSRLSVFCSALEGKRHAIGFSLPKPFKIFSVL